MKERIPKYSYDGRRTILLGLFGFCAISISVISLFAFDEVRGRYHVEPVLTLPELAVAVLLCLVAYGLAVFATISFQRTLQKFVSDSIAVYAVGSLIFGISMAAFLYVDTLIDIRNHRELSFSFSGDPPRPVLPTILELLLYAGAIASASFVSTSVLNKVFR